MNAGVVMTFTDPYVPIMIHADISCKQFTPLDRLTSILISRFLCDLQAAGQKSTGMVSSTGSQVESIILQRVIGSLGSAIELEEDTNVDGTESDGASAGDSGAGEV